MEKLRLLHQDLLSTLKNKSVTQKMKAWMENIVQRWDNLVQKVEKTSSQVNDTNYYTIHYAQ
jgi:dystrophin